MEVTISREIRGHSVSMRGDEHVIDEILGTLTRTSEAIKKLRTRS